MVGFTLALRSKAVVGCSPLSIVCVFIWVWISSYVLCAEPKPRGTKHRAWKISINHLLQWLSFFSTVKSALYCSARASMPSGGSLCLHMPQWTVSLSRGFESLDYPYRRGIFQLITTPVLRSISSDSWTFQQQGHWGLRQGTCLKSQRPLLEDSWTSSCVCGTPAQPLSQGHGKDARTWPDLLCLHVQSTGIHRSSSLLGFQACRNRHLEEHKALLLLL